MRWACFLWCPCKHMTPLRHVSCHADVGAQAHAGGAHGAGWLECDGH